MWYLAVFVPESQAALATELAHAVWPDDPNGSAQLGVRLEDHDGPLWLGANAAVTDGEIAALQAIVEIPSVRWYRYSLDGVLGMAWPLGQAGEGAPWGWPQSVAAAGLTIVPQGGS